MQTNPEDDAQIDGIYRVIKGKIDWEDMVPTLLDAAQEIEAIRGLKGPEKLALLQKALKHALKESTLSADEKEVLLHTIDTMVPIAIRAAILASKSPILAQVKTVCVGCWTKA